MTACARLQVLGKHSRGSKSTNVNAVSWGQLCLVEARGLSSADDVCGDNLRRPTDDSPMQLLPFIMRRNAMNEAYYARTRAEVTRP
jgi:hypothetical protein